MGDFGQRVGLIHKLTQGAGSEECIDNARDSLGVDKVDRSEYLRVTDVHALADCARHTCEADAKLVVQLLAHGAHTAVAQVVDVVDIGL